MAISLALVDCNNFDASCERVFQPSLRDRPVVVLSATIIVSGASAWTAPYHDRMPLLSGELGPEALRPAAESALREWVVSKRVNRTGVGDDDPSAVAHADAA